MKVAAAYRCCICDKATEIKPLYPKIVQCQQCGHVFLDAHFKNEELEELYRKEFFFGKEYRDYLLDKNVLQKNFRLRLKILSKFTDPTRHRSLLEIGCAYGFFLELTRPHFDSVLGIDIAENGIKYAREQLKLNAIYGDFLKYDFGKQTFDIVCLWDTIEHLQNPDYYIKKIAQHTGHNALLALTTGDVQSLNARFRKDKWRMLGIESHLHHFSHKTLAKLLKRYDFEILYNRHCGFYRSIDFVAYRMLVLTDRSPWLYKLLRKSGLAGADFYFNLYDIMYVIARKT